MPGREARRGLQVEHFDGQIGDRLAGPLLLPRPSPAADVGQRRPAFRCRRHIFAPVRSSRPARRFLCRREIRAPGVLRPGPLFRAVSAPGSDRSRATVDDVDPLRAARESCRSRVPGGGAWAIQIGPMEQLAAADQRDAVATRRNPLELARAESAAGPRPPTGSRRKYRPSVALRPRSGRR